MKIGVPSGIGDISWVVSKLINSPQWSEIEFIVADGWPFRAAPYLSEMLGKKCDYGNFQYDTIVMFEQLNPYHTWRDVLAYQAGTFHLQPNYHLEKGKPLSEWLPDLSTSYHYPLVTPSIEGKPYYERIAHSPNPMIGISAASYRGHKAWKTWDIDTWKELLLSLVDEGFDLCFVGGSWDDLTKGVACDLFSLCPSRVLNIVGMTSFPEACAIHKITPFFIGFSSGIGIIRTVMELPTMMLWPDHQIPLSESWADPLDIASGRYVPMQYVNPSLVRSIFLGQAKQWGVK